MEKVIEKRNDTSFTILTVPITFGFTAKEKSTVFSISAELPTIVNKPIGLAKGVGEKMFGMYQKSVSLVSTTYSAVTSPVETTQKIASSLLETSKNLPVVGGYVPMVQEKAISIASSAYGYVPSPVIKKAQQLPFVGGLVPDAIVNKQNDKQ